MECAHIIVKLDDVKPEIMASLGGTAAGHYSSIKKRESNECLIEANLKECTIDFWDDVGYRYILYEEGEIRNFINEVVSPGTKFEKHG